MLEHLRNAKEMSALKPAMKFESVYIAAFTASPFLKAIVASLFDFLLSWPGLNFYLMRALVVRADISDEDLTQFRCT